MSKKHDIINAQDEYIKTLEKKLDSARRNLEAKNRYISVLTKRNEELNQELEEYKRDYRVYRDLLLIGNVAKGIQNEQE